MPGGIGFVWIPGGPISTDKSRITGEMLSLHTSIEEMLGHCYLRCNVMSPAIKTDFYMSNSFMRRPQRPVNSRYSVFLDLTKDDDLWLKSLRKGHRYGIRTSLRHQVDWSISNQPNDLEALADLLREMVREKNISIPIYSHAELLQLRTHLEDGILTIIGRIDGRPVSGALVVVLGNRAHYLAAATNRSGRTASAAYGMMFQLRRELKARGIRIFDLGGIAPHDLGASGVDHFKLGFGGETVEYLGEWDAGSRISRFLGNVAVTRLIRTTSRSREQQERMHGVKWREWLGSASDWDTAIMGLKGWSIFQSFRWGEHRRRFGWTPIRLIAEEDGRTVAMMQVQTRRYFSSVGFVWSPGGLAGEISSCGPSMRTAIADLLGVRYVVYRFNVMRQYEDIHAVEMSRNGWTNSKKLILSGFSLSYDLTESAEVRESRLSRNWRHNLRRSLKRDIHAYHWLNPQPEKIKNIYDQMLNHKGIEHLAQQNSLESISSLLTQFGGDCLIVRCDDAEGNMIAVRGALLMGGKAWDTFAAATPEGRKTYASYRAFWELMELCRQRGVVTYDMGGADPINNRGVYDFKQGTGAEIVRFLGEWEYSRPQAIGLLAGRRIALRAG